MLNASEICAHPVLDIERELKRLSHGEAMQVPWPCDRTLTSESRYALFKRMVVLADDVEDRDDFCLIALEASAVHWVTTIVDIVHAQRLADAFLNRDIKAVHGKRYPLLNAMMERSRLPDARHLQLLRSGPATSSLWRRALRVAKYRFSEDHIRASLVLPREDIDDITTFEMSSMTRRHATQEKRPVRLRDLGLWFKPASGGAGYRHLDLANAVVECVQGEFSKGGLILWPEVRQWLATQIAETFCCIEQHTQRLRTLEYIPRVAWIGSSSAYWPRLLARETMRRGGTVTAHDHGSGTGRVRESAVLYALKGFCTEFVTGEAEQACTLHTLLAKEGFTSAPIPKVRAIGGPKPPTGILQKSRPRGNDPVMLLPLTLTGERTTLVPHPDDVTCQDMNYRLVRELRDAGHEVLLKPHPEFDFAAMGELASSLGAKLLSGRFEDVAYRAGVFIFCHPLTSTFAWCLERGLPVVLIDFGFVTWTAWGTKALAGRVEIVPGGRGRDGSLTVDMAGLRRAVEKAKTRRSLVAPS